MESATVRYVCCEPNSCDVRWGGVKQVRKRWRAGPHNNVTVKAHAPLSSIILYDLLNSISRSSRLVRQCSRIDNRAPAWDPSYARSMINNVSCRTSNILRFICEGRNREVINVCKIFVYIGIFAGHCSRSTSFQHLRARSSQAVSRKR